MSESQNDNDYANHLWLVTLLRFEYGLEIEETYD